MTIDASDEPALEQLRSGQADVELVTVDAGVAGELLRADLKLLAVIPVAPFAASDPRADRSGPVLRLFIDPAREGGT